jgi:hypothetical protein
VAVACLSTFAKVPVPSFPCRYWYRCCVASVSAVACILAVTDVPSVVVFPSVPNVYYCRRIICCFSVVAGFPADSGIPAVAEVSAIVNVLRWCGRRLCCCFQNVHYTVSKVQCIDGMTLY